MTFIEFICEKEIKRYAIHEFMDKFTSIDYTKRILFFFFSLYITNFECENDQTACYLVIGQPPLSESRIFSQVRIVSKILEGLTPIIKVATHTGGLVPATSSCNYSPEEFTRRDWSQGLVPSSVSTQGPIAQESSKNWGQMVSFFHSTAFLRNQNS